MMIMKRATDRETTVFRLETNLSAQATDARLAKAAGEELQGEYNALLCQGDKARMDEIRTKLNVVHHKLIRARGEVELDKRELARMGYHPKTNRG